MGVYTVYKVVNKGYKVVKQASNKLNKAKHSAYSEIYGYKQGV